MRRKLTAAQLQTYEASKQMQEIASKPKSKRRPRTFGPKAKAKALTDVQARIDRSRLEGATAWEGMTATDLVWLYAWCHIKVYEIEPTDIEGQTIAKAIVQASRMLKDKFGGQPELMVDYIRWAWKRAETRVGKDGGNRLGWYNLFAGKFVISDYLVARARSKKA